MIIIDPSYEIIDMKEPKEIMLSLERCARTCYQSEGLICEGSADRLIQKLIKMDHEAMIEHEKITIKFICDRGVSHELVRHRLASWAQESTRYVNYSKEKYGSEIKVIKPCFWGSGRLQEADVEKFQFWYESCLAAEYNYMRLIESGATPQEARSVLPNSTKTEIIMTCNLRELRHFCKLRAAKSAHPQMRELVYPLLLELKEKLPILFTDIYEEVQKSYGRA